MAFWSKKKITDYLIKYLNDQNVSFKEEYGCITFELYMSKCEYSLYPYIKIDEDNEQISIIVNLKKVEDLNSKEYNRVNNFNVNSKYFTCKNKDNVLILEYNANITTDTLVKVIENSIGSLYDLEEQIDNL